MVSLFFTTTLFPPSDNDPLKGRGLVYSSVIPSACTILSKTEIQRRGQQTETPPRLDPHAGINPLCFLTGPSSAPSFDRPALLLPQPEHSVKQTDETHLLRLRIIFLTGKSVSLGVRRLSLRFAKEARARRGRHVARNPRLG